jgi:hypothetical protein
MRISGGKGGLARGRWPAARVAAGHSLEVRIDFGAAPRAEAVAIEAEP